MTKRRNLPIRALGAEPDVPAVTDLLQWVAARRGSAGDLISYQLETLLLSQTEAGVTLPCGGGTFYRDRLVASFTGIENGVITGETGVRPEPLAADSYDLCSLFKGAWCALPAPHMLGISDRYYGDEDDAADAIVDLYKAALRTMRDSGLGGHTLICDHAIEEEITSLARRKVFFFQPEPSREDLELLLEYQQQVAASPDQLGDVIGLRDEYDISRLILVDPDRQSIDLALSAFDPDHLVIGGYCRDSCSTYWGNLVDQAYYTG